MQTGPELNYFPCCDHIRLFISGSLTFRFQWTNPRQTGFTWHSMEMNYSQTEDVLYKMFKFHQGKIWILSVSLIDSWEREETERQKCLYSNESPLNRPVSHSLIHIIWKPYTNVKKVKLESVCYCPGLETEYKRIRGVYSTVPVHPQHLSSEGISCNAHISVYMYTILFYPWWNNNTSYHSRTSVFPGFHLQ